MAGEKGLLHLRLNRGRKKGTWGRKSSTLSKCLLGMVGKEGGDLSFFEEGVVRRRKMEPKRGGWRGSFLFGGLKNSGDFSERKHFARGTGTKERGGSALYAKSRLVKGGRGKKGMWGPGMEEGGMKKESRRLLRDAVEGGGGSAVGGHPRK